jgi:cytochrome c-type biogenesis protein CcmE
MKNRHGFLPNKRTAERFKLPSSNSKRLSSICSMFFFGLKCSICYFFDPNQSYKEKVASGKDNLGTISKKG